MRTSMTMLAVVAILGFMISACASGGAGPKDLTGTVAKVDTRNSTLTIRTSEMREVTFTVDSRTKISVGGKDGTLSDLKEGQRVKLNINGSKAVSIET
jgi:hypothetical protein